MSPSADPHALSRPTRGLVTLLCALLAAVLFTWPFARDPFGAFVSRGFDGPCTIWMGWWMGHHFDGGGLTSALTSWPMGEDLRGNDGWLYLFAAWLLPGFGSPFGAQLWGFLGCAASFLAAERLAARAFGARWPWSMAAGLVFACNGVAAASLAEGRFYHLAQWPLPLLLLAQTRLAEPDERHPHRVALGLGLAWVLCLGTSAYTAILGAFAASWSWATRSGRLLTLRRAWPAALVALPPFVLFSKTFLASGRTEAWVGTLPTLRNSATLAGFLGWSPAAAEEPGFACPALGLASLALALVALRWLPRRRALPLFLGALLAAALSLGFHTHWSALHTDPIRTPLGLLREIVPAIAFFRFPVRFLILTHLALGVLAALALSEARGRLLRLGFVAALIVDAFFWSTPVFSFKRSSPVAFHPVYERAPVAPLLDLLPHTSVRLDYALLVLIHDVCVQQTRHGRPLLEDCLFPSAIHSPAWQLRRDLLPPLLANDARKAGRLLANAGVASVALRPGLFTEADAAAIEGTLSALSAGRFEDTVGGEHVELFLLHPNLRVRRP